VQFIPHVMREVNCEKDVGAEQQQRRNDVLKTL
jgi:hypothetical protein